METSSASSSLSFSQFPPPARDYISKLPPEVITKILKVCYDIEQLEDTITQHFPIFRLVSRLFNELVKPIHYQKWSLVGRMNDPRISSPEVEPNVIRDVASFAKRVSLTDHFHELQFLSPLVAHVPRAEIIEWELWCPQKNRTRSEEIWNVTQDMRSIFENPLPNLREIRFRANRPTGFAIQDAFTATPADSSLPKLTHLELKRFLWPSNPQEGKTLNYFNTITHLKLHSVDLLRLLKFLNSSNVDISRVRTLELHDAGEHIAFEVIDEEDGFCTMQKLLMRIDALESFSFTSKYTLELFCLEPEYEMNLPIMESIFEKHGPTLRILKLTDLRVFLREEILQPLSIGIDKMLKCCSGLEELDMDIDIRSADETETECGGRVHEICSQLYEVLTSIHDLPKLRKLTIHVPTVYIEGGGAKDFHYAHDTIDFIRQETKSQDLCKIIVVVEKIIEYNGIRYNETPEDYCRYFDWAPDIEGYSGMGTMGEMAWDEYEEKLIRITR